MPTPFTTLQLNALSVMDVTDLIGRAAMHLKAYATRTDMDGDDDALPWWWFPSGNWRRIFKDWPWYEGIHPWFPVYCADRATLEIAGEDINSLHGTTWAYDEQATVEANARALLAAVNAVTDTTPESQP